MSCYFRSDAAKIGVACRHRHRASETETSFQRERAQRGQSERPDTVDGSVVCRLPGGARPRRCPLFPRSVERVRRSGERVARPSRRSPRRGRGGGVLGGTAGRAVRAPPERERPRRFTFGAPSVRVDPPIPPRPFLRSGRRRGGRDLESAVGVRWFRSRDIGVAMPMLRYLDCGSWAVVCFPRLRIRRRPRYRCRGFGAATSMLRCRCCVIPVAVYGPRHGGRDFELLSAAVSMPWIRDRNIEVVIPSLRYLGRGF